MQVLAVASEGKLGTSAIVKVVCFWRSDSDSTRWMETCVCSKEPVPCVCGPESYDITLWKKVAFQRMICYRIEIASMDQREPEDV